MKDDTYYVRLTVDGKKVPENKHCGSATSSKCRFRVSRRISSQGADSRQICMPPICRFILYNPFSFNYNKYLFRNNRKYRTWKLQYYCPGPRKMANGGGGWGKGDNSNFLQYFAATLGKNSNHYLPWQWRRGPRGRYHHPRENVHGPLRHQRGRKLQWPHGENRQGLRGTHVVCPEERKWERCLVSVSLVVSSSIVF